MTLQREERNGEKEHMDTDVLLTHTETKHRHRRVSDCLTVIRKQTWDVPLRLLTAGKSPVREINRGHLTFGTSEDKGTPPLVANTPISNTEFLPVSALQFRLLILFATG